MTRPDRVPRELADAAAVHAARDAVVAALGPLAASPLNEQATSSMRAALSRVSSPAVRGAIRRLTRPPGPRPSLVIAAAVDARSDPAAAEDRSGVDQAGLDQAGVDQAGPGFGAHRTSAA